MKSKKRRQMIPKKAVPSNERDLRRQIKEAEDLQEGRALELEYLHYSPHALKVRHCQALKDGKTFQQSGKGRNRGLDYEGPESPWWVKLGHVCHLRDCPTCAKAMAKARGATVFRYAQKMKHPEHVVLSVTSRGIDDLAETLTWLRRCLSRLRTQKCCRNIRSAIGGIEAQPCQDGPRWNAHAHLIMDVRRLRLKSMHRAWKRLLNKLHRKALAVAERDAARKALRPKGEAARWKAEMAAAREAYRDSGLPLRKRFGSVKCEEKIRTLKNLSLYVTKSRDTCPEPGSISPHQYDVLRAALKHRKLLVEWGTHRRGRKPKAPRPEAETGGSHHRAETSGRPAPARKPKRRAKQGAEVRR